MMPSSHSSRLALAAAAALAGCSTGVSFGATRRGHSGNSGRFQAGDGRVNNDLQMHMRRTTSLAVIIGALVVSIQSITAADSKHAPNVALHTADGVTVQLADYKGKVVLIDFWASWCPPCKASFPALDAIYREYQGKGLEVLAVNVDERRRDADTFLNAHPHRLTVLYDPKGVSPEAFGVKGMPSSFLIDRAGNIRFIHMGYSGNVADSYRQEIAQLLSEH
jgi:thiol-disulfide isomerase/thioredoxin